VFKQKEGRRGGKKQSGKTRFGAKQNTKRGPMVPRATQPKKRGKFRFQIPFSPGWGEKRQKRDGDDYPRMVPKKKNITGNKKKKMVNPETGGGGGNGGGGKKKKKKKNKGGGAPHQTNQTASEEGGKKAPQHRGVVCGGPFF